jgi:rhodanese-related sulfurtransferase
MSVLKSISAEQAAERIRAGAVLVDIRELDEHVRERIPGARHHALSMLDKASPARSGDDILIFHCKSGARTQANTPRLAAAAGCEAYVLEGGIEAWKKLGLPVASDRKHPIAMARQVQILAGGLVLLGMVLGLLLTPAFYALSAFVGAGLVFAGVTDFCASARLLALMPWNRGATSASVPVTKTH